MPPPTFLPSAPLPPLSLTSPHALSPPCVPTAPSAASPSRARPRRRRVRRARLTPSMRSSLPLQERLLRLERALSLAVSQERYTDAASLRDALAEARNSDPALLARDALSAALAAQDFAAAARHRDEIARATERFARRWKDDGQGGGEWGERERGGRRRKALRVDRIVVLRAQPDQPGRLRVATVGRDGGVEFPLEPKQGRDEPRIYLQPCYSPSGDFVCCTEISFKVLGTEGNAKVVSMAESEHRVVVMNAFDGEVVKSIPVRKPPFFYYWSPCGRKLSMLYNGADESDGGGGEGLLGSAPTVSMSAIQVVAPPSAEATLTTYGGAGEDASEKREGSSIFDTEFDAAPPTPTDALTAPVVSGHPVLYDFCPRDSDRVVAHVGDKSEVVVASLRPGRSSRVITRRAGAFGTPQWHPRKGEHGREVVLFVEGAPEVEVRKERIRAKATAVATAAVSLMDALDDDDVGKSAGKDGDKDSKKALEGNEKRSMDNSLDNGEGKDSKVDDDEEDGIEVVGIEEADVVVNFIDVDGVTGDDGEAGDVDGDLGAVFGEGYATARILPAKGISDLARSAIDADEESVRASGSRDVDSKRGARDSSSSSSSSQSSPAPFGFARAIGRAIRRSAEGIARALPEGAVPGIPTGRELDRRTNDAREDRDGRGPFEEATAFARGERRQKKGMEENENRAPESSASRQSGSKSQEQRRLKKEPWGGKKDRNLARLYMADVNDPTMRRCICQCSGIVSFKLSPNASTLALLVNNPDSGEDELSLCYGDFSPDSVVAGDGSPGVEPPTQQTTAESSEKDVPKADVILSTPDSKVLAFFWSPDGSKLLFLSSLRNSTVGAARWATFDLETMRVARYEPFIMSAMFAHSLSFFCAYSNAMTPWSPDSDAFCYAGRSLTPEEKKAGGAEDKASQANAATLLTALMLQKKKAADSGKGIPFSACVQNIATVRDSTDTNGASAARGKLVIEPPRVVMSNVELTAWSQC